MKRLLEEPQASLGSLTRLVESAERLEPSPFAKRAVKLRISRAVASPAVAPPRLALRPALLGVAGLLLAATAAAAGYAVLSRREPVAPVAPAVAPGPSPLTATPRAAASPIDEPAPVTSQESVAPAPEAVANEPLPVAPPSVKRNADKPRPGEDPTQVAEAVRALRKQGDSARAQALLEQYLKNNPRGALAEDALALSIEAAAARKDPRAADYARRYLARYPKGRFRAVAERALAR